MTTSSDQSPSHNVFVYGSFQEPAISGLILECTPVIVSAQLNGLYVFLHVSDLPFDLNFELINPRYNFCLLFFFCSHLYRLKGRLHACISPSENGKVNGKV